MANIGKNIKLFRTGKNMTQEAFAEQLFVSRQTVSNYENNKSNPDIDMLMKMAEVLVNDARKDLIVNYPVVLYEGETVSEENKAEYGKSFSEPLTVKLLEEQQNFFKKAKGN